jgi:hypothetical protein
MQHDQTTKSFDPEGAEMKSWKDKYSQGGKYAVGIDWKHWQQFEDYGKALLEDPPDFAIYRSGDGKDLDRLLTFSRDFAESGWRGVGASPASTTTTVGAGHCMSSWRYCALAAPLLAPRMHWASGETSSLERS